MSRRSDRSAMLIEHAHVTCTCACTRVALAFVAVCEGRADNAARSLYRQFSEFQWSTR